MRLFLRNVSWLIASSLLVRAVRLVARFATAALVSPEIFGSAALILTLHELFATVAHRSGLGTRLVQARDEAEFARLLPSGRSLNSIVCCTVAGLQATVALVWWGLDPSSGIPAPLLVLATTHLMAPFYFAEQALIWRRNELRVVALTDAVLLGLEPLVVLALAACGLGTWAFVLPFLYKGAGRLFAYRQAAGHPERAAFSLAASREFRGVAFTTLAAELQRSFRNGIDNVLVGRFLGLQQLGLYAFAYNASWNVLQELTTHSRNALHAYVSPMRADPGSFELRTRHGLLVITGGIALAAVALVLAAPLVFRLLGPQWQGALPCFVLLSSIGITRPLAEGMSAALVSRGELRFERRWNTSFTAAFVLALCVGLRGGIEGVAWALLAVHTILNPTFAVLAYRRLRSRPTADAALQGQRALG